MDCLIFKWVRAKKEKDGFSKLIRTNCRQWKHPLLQRSVIIDCFRGTFKLNSYFCTLLTFSMHIIFIGCLWSFKLYGYWWIYAFESAQYYILSIMPFHENNAPNIRNWKILVYRFVCRAHKRTYFPLIMCKDLLIQSW